MGISVRHAREYSSYVIKELLKHDTLRPAGSSDIVVIEDCWTLYFFLNMFLYLFILLTRLTQVLRASVL